MELSLMILINYKNLNLQLNLVIVKLMATFPVNIKNVFTFTKYVNYSRPSDKIMNNYFCFPCNFSENVYELD